LTNFGLGLRFARQRRKRRASLEKSGLVTPPIRQTLASRAFNGKRSHVPHRPHLMQCGWNNGSRIFRVSSFVDSKPVCCEFETGIHKSKVDPVNISKRLDTLKIP
jgi:hypothetical protein